MSESPELCHCGQPLHYTNLAVKAMVDDLIARAGTHIHVVVEGCTYLVPRHYIALHGLKGADVPQLGFEEMPGG